MESIMEQWGLELKRLKNFVVFLWGNKWFILVFTLIFNLIIYACYVANNYYVSSNTFSFSLSLALFQTLIAYGKMLIIFFCGVLAYVIFVFLTPVMVGQCRHVIKKSGTNVAITMMENETTNIEDIQIDKGVDDVSNDNYFSEKKRPKLIINDEKLGQMFCDDFNKHRYNFLKEFLEGLSGKNLKIIYGRIALKIYEKSQGRQYILRESIRDTSFPDYCKFFFESIGLFVKIPDRNTCNRRPLPVEIDTDLNKLLEPTIKE